MNATATNLSASTHFRMEAVATDRQIHNVLMVVGIVWCLIAIVGMLWDFYFNDGENILPTVHTLLCIVVGLGVVACVVAALAMIVKHVLWPVCYWATFAVYIVMLRLAEVVDRLGRSDWAGFVLGD